MDRSLVERAKRGDAEAFDALARTVGDRCMAIAVRILRDADLAEDAVQAALIFSYAGGPPQGAATNRGLTEYLWVIDVAGTPVIVATSTNAQTFDDLDPLIQSIDFDH